MNSTKLYIVRLFIKLFPETRLFNTKRKLYRFTGATIGTNCKICSSAFVLGSGNLEIGANTWIGHKSTILSASGLKIGKSVDIAPHVFIGTGTHKIDLQGERVAGEGISLPIEIGDGCWICAGAIILPGTKLGEKCIVAAGAVVKGEFGAYSLIGGVPAKLIRKLKNCDPLSN
ncbi:acyltransferase [Saccharicrinis sp. FJH54]|uniref:acyltransferase n=1 Tax=Saccharicrinis sp. FJH54 TaxID=3344665 RepID=UPI0035D47633